MTVRLCSFLGHGAPCPMELEPPNRQISMMRSPSHSTKSAQPAMDPRSPFSKPSAEVPGCVWKAWHFKTTICGCAPQKIKADSACHRTSGLCPASGVQSCVQLNEFSCTVTHKKDRNRRTKQKDFKIKIINHNHIETYP